MFRKFRIMLLLYVLLLAAGGTWLTRERTTDWDETLWVVVHPIAGDAVPSTRTFVNALSHESFKDIETFFASEAARHGVGLKQPFRVRVGAILDEQPPAPPAGGNTFAIMWWSLKLRWWSWNVGREHDDVPAHIRVYMILHDPERNIRVADSLGLQKGLIGVTHGFAGRKFGARNNVIVAHELLHTVGASDKYDYSTNLPIHPQGFAEPARNPLYPQRKAEIMGGRIPRSSTQAEIPASLTRVVVGRQTALEIRWRQ